MSLQLLSQIVMVAVVAEVVSSPLPEVSSEIVLLVFGVTAVLVCSPATGTGI